MATPNADRLLGTTAGPVVVDQLIREQKRQARSAPNAIAQVAGALDDGVLVGILDTGTDLTGYLPAITEEP